MENNLNKDKITNWEKRKKELESLENIKNYVQHNYKMRYAKDKRGFWVIVNYRGHKYYGFLEETLLRDAIDNNTVDQSLRAIMENIAKKIEAKQATNINTYERQKTTQK